MIIKTFIRNIRNLHKKLAASAKADSVIAENPGISLEDLVASKKLNNDQKAQILKKPALQAQLIQLEDQLTHYRTFVHEIEEKHNQEKQNLIDSHEAEIARVKEEVLTQNQGNQAQQLETSLKVIAHFLHAAASKRQSEDADSEEGRAFEGALLLVYQGNEASLTTLKNLINGSDEKVPDVQGDLLDYTFAQIKQSALQEINQTEEELEETKPVEPTSDPTIVNAGLTELEDTTKLENPTNGHVQTSTVPEQISTGSEAANAVAEASWDPQASIITDTSANAEEWVQVPRDPTETETGVQATPAAVQSSTNWAEEVGAAEEKVKSDNDGFEQVRRDRGNRGGRGRGGRGEFRGRGRGRGDGFRGRGGPPRGRGGPKGDKS